MKKRLRKKYRVGEFREYCFRVTFKFNENVDADGVMQFVDEFREQSLDEQGLYFEGLLSLVNECSFIVKADDPRTTNEEQRAAVKAWFEGRQDITLGSVSGLMDAWYGDAED